MIAGGCCSFESIKNKDWNHGRNHYPLLTPARGKWQRESNSRRKDLIMAEDMSWADYLNTGPWKAWDGSRRVRVGVSLGQSCVVKFNVQSQAASFWWVFYMLLKDFEGILEGGWVETGENRLQVLWQESIVEVSIFFWNSDGSTLWAETC